MLEGSRPELVIAARGVSKVYGEVEALHEVDLEVDTAELVALAGPSGSGKSTLLNLIGGLDTPSAGTIEVAGRMLTSMRPTEKADLRLHSIGFVFQSFNLIPVLTALENVEYVLRLQGRPARERRERARDALDDVGLDGLGGRRPSELSGGQQQRVAIARAIVHRPALLLADEITASVDSKTAAALIDLMEDLNRRLRTTVLFASHDPAVLRRARRIVELRDGRILGDRLHSVAS